jgi:trimethylamine:corrinoid methyltransferase-like protein
MINSAFKPWIYWYSSPGIKKGTIGIEKGQLRFLTNDQIKDIDAAAKEILERTGVKVPNEACLKLLEKAGARVDFKEKRTWIKEPSPSTPRRCTSSWG